MNASREGSSAVVEEFKLRIVSLDYYMSRPNPVVDESYSEFAGAGTEVVPVVRIFGSTPAGQAVCLHLHKAFPYFYVDYDLGRLPSEATEVSIFMRQIGLGLDTALQMEEFSRGQQGAKSSYVKMKQHVFNVQLVRARKFYGYHQEEDLFMKIIMYNPREVTKAANLLQRGVIMGHKFQPYEAHLPFLLQIKMDYNLAGMSHVRLSKVIFRSPLPEHHIHRLDAWEMSNFKNYMKEEKGSPMTGSPTCGSPSEYLWTKSSVPCELLWSEEVSEKWMCGRAEVEWLVCHRCPQRQTCCELEVDGCMDHVLNRKECVRMPLEEAHDDERLVESLVPMWNDERKRLGRDPPCRPPSPQRDPKSLCDAVEATRSEIKGLVGEGASQSKNSSSITNMQNLELRGITQAANLLTSPQRSGGMPQASQCPSVEIQGEQLVDCQALSQLRSDEESQGIDDDDPLMALVEAAAEDEVDWQESQQEVDDIMTCCTDEVEGDEVAQGNDAQVDVVPNSTERIGSEKKRQHSSINHDASSHDLAGHGGGTTGEERVKCGGHPRKIQKICERSSPEMEQGDVGVQHGSSILSKQDNGTPVAMRHCSRGQVKSAIEAAKAAMSLFMSSGESGGGEVGDVEPYVRHAATSVERSSGHKSESSGASGQRLPVGGKDEELRKRRDSSSQCDVIVGQRENDADDTGDGRWEDTGGLEQSASQSQDKSSPRAEVKNVRQSGLQCLSLKMRQDSRNERLDAREKNAGEEHDAFYFRPKVKPPTADEVDGSLGKPDVLPVVHMAPHFGDPKDVPQRHTVMAGREFRIPAKHVQSLPPFSRVRTGIMEGRGSNKQAQSTANKAANGSFIWVPRFKPPRPQEVMSWVTGKEKTQQTPESSQTTQESDSEQMVLSISSLGESQPVPVTPSVRIERPPSPKYDEPCFYNVHSNETTPIAALSPMKSRTASPLPSHVILPTPKQEKGSRPTTPPSSTSKPAAGLSQITLPSAIRSRLVTPPSQAGFNQGTHEEGQQLVVLSMEVHADCRGSLLPDPRYDAVRCIVMASTTDSGDLKAGSFPVHFMLLDPAEGLPKYSVPEVGNATYEVFADEKLLIDEFAKSLRELDPDIIMGFEMQQHSIGYLVDRANLLEINLLRIPGLASAKEFQDDSYGKAHATGYHSTGRILLNLWRILRGELTLNIYTFENCVQAVLQIRTPLISHVTLASWFNGCHEGGGRWRCLSYFLRRAWLNLLMVEQLDLLGRTAEMARTYGIDFFSVLSRGSQYRVESMLARLAHTQNYLLISPSKEQVFKQPGMECLPLVMEPESRLYTAPVVVLDFQSLYPSVTIAYNLCYSTCVGRAYHMDAEEPLPKLGVTQFSMPLDLLSGGMSPEKLNVMPNLISYVSRQSRPGVLPRLLQEILKTRVMVKSAMKQVFQVSNVRFPVVPWPCLSIMLCPAHVASEGSLGGLAEVAGQKAKVPHSEEPSRQPQVFDSRMPFAELADSIVQSGRETLQNAIKMVEGHPRWNAKVKYGDTDSLFVLLEGRTREQAFEIGKEIAEAVTAANPRPIELKLEKVYQPCILQTKKRYVGYSYEHPDQAAPVFDAKGIETVRRDACPAVSKILERVTRILFETADLSQVKSFLERQWSKILMGRISFQDFVFAKEVRVGSYSSKASTIPPAAVVAAKAMTRDPRAEPRQGARVPYVIVCGEPGARLVDMVTDPHTLLNSGGQLRLHAIYYITKQINPTVNRVISLVGVDVGTWFSMLPRPQRLLPHKRPGCFPGHAGGKSKPKGTIDSYYLSRHCAVCDELTYEANPLCEQCAKMPQVALAVLMSRFTRLQRQFTQLKSICVHCGGGDGRRAASNGKIVCQSLDCGVYFERRKLAEETGNAEALTKATCDMF